MHLRTDTSANAHFSRVPSISHSRNAFSVAEKHVTTIQFDTLYPLFMKMIYPGDTLAVTQKSLARLQTQIAPLYDDLYFDAHAWFVPLRLLQDNWARFQFNSQPLGPTQDNSALTTPKINLALLGTGGFPSKSLYDYFGYPTKIDMTGLTNEHMHNYPARAYNMIWNENYRDQNLQAAIQVDLGDGPDDPTKYVLKKRGKRHDKFTSALTSQQKGPAVTLPLGSSAPIVGINADTQIYNVVDGNRRILEFNTNANLQGLSAPAGNGHMRFGENVGLIADLTAATAATLNQLRQSVAVQHLLEADARGGTRDVEAIAHRWGVQVPDFRLQRPEYLGGSTWTFDGHMVPQTSATVTGQTPQANLTQFSQSLNAMPVNHSFVEHGVFMILVSARSNMTYQQGLSRELSYKTRFDFYQPEFANLGEVAIKNKELYFTANDTQNNATFGFQEYAYELRYSENRVSAEMRSNYATPLDSRHMAYYYTSLPTLSSAFIESFTPIARNIAVNTTVADPIQFNVFTEGKIARTLPMYSVPGLMRL